VGGRLRWRASAPWPRSAGPYLSFAEREALALLGEDFEGVVSSDHWWAYRGFYPGRRQVCRSHPIRDFTAHAEGLAAQREFGERGLNIARRLFCAWEQFQQDGDRRRLKRTVAPLQRELKALPRQGSKGKRHKLVRGFSKNLLKVWPALWTFTEIAAVRLRLFVLSLFRRVAPGSRDWRDDMRVTYRRR
jgi:hypothetical protein